MTVIAWDGQTLAADSAATSPGGCMNRVCKIGMVEVTKPRPFLGSPGVVLFGVAGHPEGLQLAHEFLAGETDELELGVCEDDMCEVIMASAAGAWLWNGKRPIPLISGAKAAIGVGAKAALAIMFNGGSATRAVEIACAVCEGCVDPVQALSLPAPEPTEEPPELHEAQK